MKKLALIILFPIIANAATIQINFGTGFNDTTAVTPVFGNSGTTLGAQRQIIFQAVADYWGTWIDSPVTIVIDAEFVPLFCQSNAAVLGSAGPFSSTSSNFNLLPNTFYPTSLIDAIIGQDNNPGAADISASFNSDIDTGCFSAGKYYYGLNDAPSGKVALYSTILHEFAHGFGFSSSASTNDGSFSQGIPTIFDRKIFDTQANLDWLSMNDIERFASMKNDPNLVWNGQNTTDNSAFLTNGKSSGLVRLYAPPSVEPGSSVSHFSTAASPDLLMEPIASDIPYDQVDLTPYLLQDLGYSLLPQVDTNLIFKSGFEN